MASLSNSIAGMNIKEHEGRFFSRDDDKTYDSDTPRTPYLTFTTPGKPAHLTVRIRSMNQGPTNSPKVDDEDDVYSNSWTWFAFGPVQEDELIDQQLHPFQTNLRDSNSGYSHTNEWKLGASSSPAEHSGRGLDEFLESFTQPPRRQVGIYPLARHAGWKNRVWQIEVEIKQVEAEWQPVGPGDVILHRSSRHVKTRTCRPCFQVSGTKKEFTAKGGEDSKLVEDIEAVLHDTSAEAIMETRLLISVAPADHPERARWSAIFGKTLADRYCVYGVMDDMNQAIIYLREAVHLNHPTHRYRGERYKAVATLVNCLRVRYELLDAVKDLQEAIDLSKEAVAAAPTDPFVMRSVCHVLRLRFCRHHRSEDIKAAIYAGEKAVSLTSATDTASKASSIIQLEQSLAAYYDDDDDLDHLNEAISITKQTMADGSDEQDTILLCHLGDHLYKRFQRTRSIQDRDESLQSYSNALHRNNSFPDCFYAARQLLSKPEFLERGLRCLNDAQAAMKLCLSLPFNVFSPADLKRHLSQAGSMASDAAAITLHFDEDPLKAIRILEMGRGILAEILHYRHYKSPWPWDVDPALADELLLAERRLEEWTTETRLSVAQPEFLTGSVPSVTDLRHIYSSKVMELRMAISEKEQSRDATPKDRSLTKENGCPAARRGPIITLNVSVHRCDALIIQESGMRSVKLPQLSQQAIRDRSSHEDNAAEKSILLLSMKDTPGLNSLSYTDKEIHAVREICSDLPLRVILPEPYRDQTISGLQDCAIFHFAGHGQADIDPLQSHLCLKDWKTSPLTVASLIETNLSSSSAFLAYLSACGTGKNEDEASSDESLHLTHMFQTVGFRHVIGTLWEVDDYLCVDMAKLVYQSLGANGLDDASVAMALHDAIRRLRRQWLREEMTQAKRRKREAVLKEGGGEEMEDQRLDGRELEDVGVTSEEFRDVIFNRAGDTKAPLWVPYVHFGV
ncbi:hypothetical protein CP533_2190 [Ophiocordyceps camponoti-saundersi (nom. inval.)]|nr:hypothetical protein CP533_2190 [Ophiocordyceps camponoti-saundersi (nom. inval.)]